MRRPSRVINYRIDVQGARADPATYMLFLLSAKPENLEDDGQLTSRVALVDFSAP